MSNYDRTNEQAARAHNAGATVRWPDGARQVDALVEAVVAELGEKPVRRHADGDLILHRRGRTMWFSCTSAGVEIVVPVAFDIQDAAQAVALTVELNRETQPFRFVLDGDGLRIQSVLSVRPFIEEHLVERIEQMLTFVDEELGLGAMRSAVVPVDADDYDLYEDDEDDEDDEDLYEVEAEDDEDDEAEGDEQEAPEDDDRPVYFDDLLTDDAWAHQQEVQKAAARGLMVVVQIKAGRNGELTARDTATIFGDDPDVILAAIKESDGQDLEWRRAEQEARAIGDTSTAEVCDVEARSWEQGVLDLRDALRLAVLGQECARS